MTQHGRYGLYLPEQVYRQTKAATALVGLSVSAVVSRLLQAWLKDPGIIDLDAPQPEPPDQEPDSLDRIKAALDKASQG